MQGTFAALDHFKLNWVLEEAGQKLQFLSKISKEDGLSSELAGYEINKLLSEQARLEENYAELLRVRSTLTGISNKRKLELTQSQIQEVAHALKENTKLLGRLFRENPSFEKDAERVRSEKAELVERLENVVGASYQTFSLSTIQTGLIEDLESQDFLRKQIVREKTLVNDIKMLHNNLKKEEEEYQNIVVEKQAHMQRQKENLARERANAEVEGSYTESEILAKEGTNHRIQKQTLTDLQANIEEVQNKKKMEVQAFNKIRDFLTRQQDQTKIKIDDWNTKVNGVRVELDTKLDNLRNEKAKALAKLEKLKEEFDVRDNNRKEKEKIVIQKDEEKQRKIEEEENLDNAVKAIQEQYRAWKEAGGVFKKPKKPKKAAGKGKA